MADLLLLLLLLLALALVATVGLLVLGVLLHQRGGVHAARLHLAQLHCARNPLVALGRDAHLDHDLAAYVDVSVGRKLL